MSVLMWDKPEKVLSTEQWSEISFEEGPRGGYVPNMSTTDMRRFKATLKYKKSLHPQVEIRKTTDNGAQVLIIVALNGWKYQKFEAPEPGLKPGERHSWNQPMNTIGYTVRMSMNGPAWFTQEDWAHLQAAVIEAGLVLEKLHA